MAETPSKDQPKTGQYMFLDESDKTVRILLGTQIDSIAYAFVDFRNLMVSAVYKDFWQEWMSPAKPQFMAVFNAIMDSNSRKGDPQAMGTLFGSLEAFVLRVKELDLIEQAPDAVKAGVRNSLNAVLLAYEKAQRECLRGKGEKAPDGTLKVEFDGGPAPNVESN